MPHAPFLSEPDATATSETTPLNSSNQESNDKARKELPGSADFGAGMCLTIWSKTAVTPWPVFADTGRIGSPSSRRLVISLLVPEMFEFGRSILGYVQNAGQSTLAHIRGMLRPDAPCSPLLRWLAAVYERRRARSAEGGLFSDITTAMPYSVHVPMFEPGRLVWNRPARALLLRKAIQDSTYVRSYHESWV